jgi:hypothetical protein
MAGQRSLPDLVSRIVVSTEGLKVAEAEAKLAGSNMSLGLGNASKAASTLEKDLAGVGKSAAGGIPLIGNFGGSLAGLPIPALAAAAAIGLLAVAAKSVVDISDRWESAQRGLKQATDASGESNDKARQFVDHFISSNKQYVSSQAEVVDSYAALVRQGLPAKKAQDDLSLALDLSTLKHIPLVAATTLLQQAEMGRGKGLVALGINMKDYPVLMESQTQATKKEEAAQKAVEKAQAAYTAAVKAHGPASAQAQGAAVTLHDATGKLAEAHNYAAERAAASAAIHDILHQRLDKGREATAALTEKQNELGNTWQTFAHKTGPPLVDLLSKAADVGLNLANLIADQLIGDITALGDTFKWLNDHALQPVIQAIQDVIGWLSQIKVPDIHLPFGIGGPSGGSVSPAPVSHPQGHAMGGLAAYTGLHWLEQGERVLNKQQQAAGGGGIAYAPAHTFNISGVGSVDEVMRRVRAMLNQDHQDFRQMLRMGMLEIP